MKIKLETRNRLGLSLLEVIIVMGMMCILSIPLISVVQTVENRKVKDDKISISNIEHVLSNSLGRFNAHSLLGFSSAQYYYEFKNNHIDQVLIDHKKNVVVEEHKISSNNNLDIVEALTLEETSKIENSIPVFELKEHVWLMPDNEYKKIGEHISQNISINTSDDHDLMYNNVHWDKLTEKDINSFFKKGQ